MRATAGTKTRRTRLNTERDTIKKESEAAKKKASPSDSSMHMYYISIFPGKPDKSLDYLLTNP